MIKKYVTLNVNVVQLQRRRRRKRTISNHTQKKSDNETLMFNEDLHRKIVLFWRNIKWMTEKKNYE